ncbi:MAG: hypothetical protein HWE27_15970 [Gammaproteobacteria bacterium]|nr:hypothetical protein [Gammaproteobacteria bacterium]
MTPVDTISYRPTWMKVIGIIMIIFGAMGILGGASEMASPNYEEMREELQDVSIQIKDERAKSSPENKDDSNTEQNPFKLESNESNNGLSDDEKQEKHEILGIEFADKMIDQALNLPKWYIELTPYLGMVKLIISILYLTSGIVLLTQKRARFRLLTATLTLSISWNLVLIGIAISSSNWVIFMTLPTAVAGLIIDVVFLVLSYIYAKELRKDLALARGEQSEAPAS